MNYKYFRWNRIIAATVFLGILMLPMATQIQAQDDVRRGGTFTITLGSEPRVISPYSGSWSSGVPAAQMFNSLLAFDDDTQPTLPGLAAGRPTPPAQGGSLRYR